MLSTKALFDRCASGDTFLLPHMGCSLVGISAAWPNPVNEAKTISKTAMILVMMIPFT